MACIFLPHNTTDLCRTTCTITWQ